jgi:hypothetical protein
LGQCSVQIIARWLDPEQGSSGATSAGPEAGGCRPKSGRGGELGMEAGRNRTGAASSGRQRPESDRGSRKEGQQLRRREERRRPKKGHRDPEQRRPASTTTAGSSTNRPDWDCQRESGIRTRTRMVADYDGQHESKERERQTRIPTATMVVELARSCSVPRP